MYSLRFLSPSGYYLTLQDHGNDPSLNSDPDPLTGRTDQFMLTSGQVPPSLDAGLVPQEVVSGSVFNDYNANGQREPGEPGEPGIGGWVVFLDDDGDGQLDADERFTSTDASGRYQFVGILLRGTQRPTLIIQDRWSLTWPLTSAYVATVQPGGSVGGLDFGVFSDTPVAFVTPLSAATQLPASGAWGYYAHRVASDDEGGYVIVRESQDTGGTYTVYLDLYDAAGSLRKSNWVLSTSDPIGFDVAMDADGNIAIARGSSSSGLYLRRYDSSGQLLGADIALGMLSNNSTWPTIAMNAAGDGAVAWWGEGNFYLRRFDAAGNLTTAAIRLNQSDMDSDQNVVQVDMNANGECVAFWREKQLEGFGVYARIFDASGTPRGDRCWIDSSSDPALDPKAVAIGDSGDFAVAWWNAELRVQRYNASAQSQGAPGHIAGTFGALDIDPDGNLAVTRFVVIGGGDDDFCSLYLELFNPAGQPLTGALEISNDAFWIFPALAVTRGGNLNVIWNNTWFGYYARRYHVAMAPDPAIPGTLDRDTYCLRRARDNVLLYTGPVATGQPSASYIIGSLSTVTIDGGAADDSLQIDFSGGSPIPAGGISFRGGDGADSVTISGTHDYDGLSIEPGRILHEDTRIAGPMLPEPISCTDTESVLLGGAGADVPLAYLRLAQMARLQILPGGQVLCLGSLSIDETATLDLSDNDMIVRGGDIVAISSAIRSGCLIGTGDDYVTLAAILNDQGDKDHTPIKTHFGTHSVLATDVLVKYTWEGDANLDGVVNADDYFQIDSGFVQGRRGWQWGDLNYDGRVDGQDYHLVDRAFLAQGGKVPAAGLFAVPSSVDPVTSYDIAAVAYRPAPSTVTPDTSVKQERIAAGFRAAATPFSQRPITASWTASEQASTSITRRRPIHDVLDEPLQSILARRRFDSCPSRRQAGHDL